VAQVHPDAQQYPERLHSIGWKVHHFNECCVLSYAHRYHLAHELLGEEDERQLVIRFNKVNCKNVVTAMLLAPVGRDSKGRIVKIKKSEGKKSFPRSTPPTSPTTSTCTCSAWAPTWPIPASTSASSSS
jgi:hypothetical protein